MVGGHVVDGHRDGRQTRHVELHAVAPHRQVGDQRAQGDALEEVPPVVARLDRLAIPLDGRHPEAPVDDVEVDPAPEPGEARADRLVAHAPEVDRVWVGRARLGPFEELGEGAPGRQRPEEVALPCRLGQLGVPSGRRADEAVGARVALGEPLVGVEGRGRLVRGGDGEHVLHQVEELHGELGEQRGLVARHVVGDDQQLAIEVGVAPPGGHQLDRLSSWGTGGFFGRSR